MFRMLSILEDSEIPKLLQKANTPLRNDSVTATSLRTQSREAYPNAGIPAAVLTGKTETPENEQFLAPGVFCCPKNLRPPAKVFYFHRKLPSGRSPVPEFPEGIFSSFHSRFLKIKKPPLSERLFLQSIIQLHEPELPRAGRRFFCGLHQY